jgi:hypothetical protein
VTAGLLCHCSCCGAALTWAGRRKDCSVKPVLSASSARSTRSCVHWAPGQGPQCFSNGLLGPGRSAAAHVQPRALLRCQKLSRGMCCIAHYERHMKADGQCLQPGCWGCSGSVLIAFVPRWKRTRRLLFLTCEMRGIMALHSHENLH